MSGLHIGHTMDGRPFTLPVEFVTSRYAVVAISGYGKTILGTKMAEQLIKLNQPFIALDVVGNWWGLRVGVGSHPGFPVLVVGGRKADLPLEASQGRRYAHALASSELPVVVDLSTTPLDDRWKWTADFCSECLSA
jgi:DNA helicase HerA-like ATPase